MFKSVWGELPVRKTPPSCQDPSGQQQVGIMKTAICYIKQCFVVTSQACNKACTALGPGGNPDRQKVLGQSGG